MGTDIATHATFARFRMDPERAEEQRQVLERVIVPGVAQAPGLLHGYWSADPDGDDRTMAFMAFSSEADAEAFAGSVRGNSEGQRSVGIELLSIDVVELVASTETGMV